MRKNDKYVLMNRFGRVRAVLDSRTILSVEGEDYPYIPVDSRDLGMDDLDIQLVQEVLGNGPMYLART